MNILKDSGEFASTTYKNGKIVFGKWEQKRAINSGLKEYYQPKINKEKETITFVNDAEVKKATSQLKSKGIHAKVVFGKTLRFQNTAEFKKAVGIIS
jgi:hypothetical protein